MVAVDSRQTSEFMLMDISTPLRNFLEWQ